MVEIRLSSSERFRQRFTVSFPEVTISVSGSEGEQTLHTVPAGKTCRVMELTIDHEGIENTVVKLLIGTDVKLRVPIPPQTERVWSCALGRVFTSEQAIKVQGSSVVGGNTHVSGSGLETAA